MGDFFRSKLPGLNPRHAYTFEELLIEMGYCPIEPEEIDLHTQMGSYTLALPIVSSPMDTVTESDMAIKMALLGGLGVIHRNCKIEEQVEEVKKVKRAVSWIIRDVAYVSPQTPITKAKKIMDERHIHGLLVKENANLVGILTKRDLELVDSPKDNTVESYMTPNVITVRESEITCEKGIKTSVVKKIMRENRIKKLPVTDYNSKVTGLITHADIKRQDEFPNNIINSEGHLPCAAAIGPFDSKRAKALKPYADMFFIDVSHFNSAPVMNSVEKIMKEIPDRPFVLGSLGMYQDAETCIQRFYDLGNLTGFRAGVGSSKICTTSYVTKAGSPTSFAVAQNADAVGDAGLSKNIAIIADGGIENGGYAAICFALGATAVMLGGALAGCDESPGELISIDSRKYKEYYGMGSKRARKKQHAVDRYTGKNLVEGVEGGVPYTGPLRGVIDELVEQMKAAMGHGGATSIYDAHEKVKLIEINPAVGVGVPKIHQF